MKVYVFALYIIMISALVPVQGIGIVHHDFEFQDAVENYGYYVEIIGPSTVSVRTQASARYLGDFGLHFSIQGGGGSIFFLTPAALLAIESDQEYYFSAYAFHNENHMIFRVLFSDINGQWIGLDFGTPHVGWSDIIYSTGNRLINDEWNFIQYNLLEILANALQADGNRFPEYEAVQIHSIEIHIATSSRTVVETCVDELSIANKPSNQVAGGGSCEISEQSSQGETDQSTSVGPVLPVPVSFAWVVGVISISLVMNRKRKV